MKAEWEFDNFTLTSITGYSSFDFAQHHDVDFLPVSFIQNLDEEELAAQRRAKPPTLRDDACRCYRLAWMNTVVRIGVPGEQSA